MDPFLEFRFGFAEVVKQAGDGTLLRGIETRGKSGAASRDASEVGSEGLLGVGL
jgi:hypothetical protein